VSGRFILVFIPGAPKSKGSLEHRGNGQMRESVIGSTTWKRIMAGMLREAWQAKYPGQRILGPCRVDTTHFLPVASLNALVIERARGNYDRDKLERNVNDAITEAGIWKDDAQNVCGHGQKSMADSRWPQGVHVFIQEIGPGPS
jgi:Holliday junction resolvase RusA-like endonuclease